MNIKVLPNQLIIPGVSGPILKASSTLFLFIASLNVILIVLFSGAEYVLPEGTKSITLGLEETSEPVCKKRMLSIVNPTVALKSPALL